MYLKMSQVFPVIAPIGIGRSGEAYNINADWAASYLAEALSVDRLVFVTDQNGILGQNNELLEAVSSKGLDELMNKQVVQGECLPHRSCSSVSPKPRPCPRSWLVC